MNRDMLGRRLERRGFEIDFALDGQEGLDKMRERKPDLVLMDMGLPVLDGWQATTQAKEDDSLKDVPIIALTAHALETDRQKALAAGSKSLLSISLKSMRCKSYYRNIFQAVVFFSLCRCLPTI